MSSSHLGLRFIHTCDMAASALSATDACAWLAARVGDFGAVNLPKFAEPRQVEAVLAQLLRLAQQRRRSAEAGDGAAPPPARPTARRSHTHQPGATASAEAVAACSAEEAAAGWASPEEAAASVRARQPGLRVDVLGGAELEAHADAAAYALTSDAELRTRGLFAAESLLAVRRLLRVRGGGGHAVRSVLATAAGARSLAPELGHLADAGGVLLLAPPEALARVMGCEHHRGVVALAARPTPSVAGGGGGGGGGSGGGGGGLDQWLRASAPAAPAAPLSTPSSRPRVVLALEGVANPENVGALFRSALALGGCAALLAPGCADPLYRKAVRASMGAAFALPYARAADDWPADLGRLRAAGWAVVALALRPGAAAPRAAMQAAAAAGGASAGVVLLVGAEGPGLSDGAIACASAVATIPMAPSADSLNVGACAAIALHALCSEGVT
jgi:tRNA G18 (ribose-2'-O)-methylase SpoU